MTHAYSLSGVWAAGAMTADGADLCNWIHTMLGSTEVLSEAERQILLDDPLVTGDEFAYALGVMIFETDLTLGLGRAVGHDGDIFGYHTQAYWLPDRHTAICTAVNQDGVSPHDLTLGAITVLFGN